MTQKERILFELREAGEAGVRGDHFLQLSMPRYAARILELRQKGYDIRTVDDHGMARYRLIESSRSTGNATHEVRPDQAGYVSGGWDSGPSDEMPDRAILGESAASSSGGCAAPEEPVSLFGDEVGAAPPENPLLRDEAA